MILYVARRLAFSVVTLFGISIILFGMLHKLPGDPASMFINPLSFNGNLKAALAAERVQLGLNRPLPVQYIKWLDMVLHGNLGVSFQTGEPVSSMLANRLGPTLLLTGAALLLALIFGIILGIIASLRRNTIADQVIQSASLAGISVPAFFTGLLGMWLLSVKLGWLPTAGMNTPGGGWGGLFAHLILPAGILAIAEGAAYTPWVRTSMLDVLGREFLLTARSKGLAPARVILRHALHNALIPLVTVVAMALPGLFGGAVIIETLFAWPGTGMMAVTAITNRDYPVLLGYDMLIAVVVLICNLIADVTNAALDPRIRLQ